MSQSQYIGNQRLLKPLEKDVLTRAYYYAINGYGNDGDKNYFRALNVETILQNYNKIMPQFGYLRDLQKSKVRLMMPDHISGLDRRCQLCRNHQGNYIFGIDKYEDYQGESHIMCDNCLVEFAKNEGKFNDITTPPSK